MICNFLLSRILCLQVVVSLNSRHFSSPSRVCTCYDSCSKINVFVHSYRHGIRNSKLRLAIIRLVDSFKNVCWIYGDGAVHLSLWPQGAEYLLAFTCIKSESPSHAQGGGGGRGLRPRVSNGWCIN